MCDLKQLKGKTVFSGFDGYIDYLYSVVEKEESGVKKMFHNSGDFLGSLNNSFRRSSEYEIVLKKRKLGGNAPILAAAVASMGASVTCAGMFDGVEKDEIDFIDWQAKERISLFSLGKPAVTYALEFADCKYMFADCGNLGKQIQELNGKREKIEQAIRAADIIACVNWAAMPEVKEVLQRVFQNSSASIKSRYLFLDLSDIRRKDSQSIQEYFRSITLIKNKNGIKTCLSINENEFDVLCKKLDIDAGLFEEALSALRNKLNLDEIILHAMKTAVFCSDSVFCTEEKQQIKAPVITTGAGDNFNAGICVAKLLDLPPKEQLNVGNRAAEYYVTNGCCANFQHVIREKEE